MRKKHRIEREPEYCAWRSMRQRCYLKSKEGYHLYGGRGITVCERWRNSYSNFVADMGRKPSPAHSLDRIDIDGNYEPGNCRWATPAEQAVNRRTNRLLTLEGETHTLSQWAARIGIDKRTIGTRLRTGWPLKDALTRPLQPGKHLRRSRSGGTDGSE